MHEKADRAAVVPLLFQNTAQLRHTTPHHRVLF